MTFRRATMVLLLAGCTDFRLVGPAANAERSFSIFLNVNHDDTLFTAVNAAFFPGSDADGNPLPLVDSTMAIQGEVVRPRVGDQLVTYEWSAAFADAGTAPDSLRVRPPVVVGVAAQPLAFLLPRRNQAYALDHVAGTDLVLDANNSPVTPPVQRTDARWSVDITAEQRPVFSINSSAPLPPQLRVPWAWFGESVTAGDSLSVSITRFEFYDLTGTAYPTAVAMFARFVWNVRIVAGGSSIVR